MVTFLGLLWMVTPNVITLKPVTVFPVEGVRCVLTNQGLVLHTMRQAYFFDFSGNLAGEHRPEDGMLINSAYAFDDYFLLSLTRPDNSNQHTIVTDQSGVVLSRSDFFAHYFRLASGRHFAYHLEKEFAKKKSKPFRLVEVFIDQKHRLSYGEPVTDLGRITEKQRSLQYQFKQSWLVIQDDHYFWVNQMEPRVYQYDSSQKRQMLAYNAFNNSPFVSIDLPGLIPIEMSYDIPKGMFTKQESRRMFQNWWFGRSRVTGFYGYRDGFLIGYEIPECENDHCYGNKLAFQRLDANFKTVSSPVHSRGIFAGVVDDTVYVLKIEEDPPLPEGDTLIYPRLVRIAID